MNQTFNNKFNLSTVFCGCHQMNNGNNRSHNFYNHFPTKKILIKWSLSIWLLIGIGFYLIDVFIFTSTIKSLFQISSDIVFLLAICNNISLLGAICFELRSLLIISILIDCALLVAVPALIVEVVPNLLTYASLMISIILSIVYGALYMRDPLFYADIEDPYTLPYDYLTVDRTSRSRLSYNCPQTNCPYPNQQDGVLTISANIPRHSCQF